MNSCKFSPAVLAAVLLLPYAAARADTAAESYDLDKAITDYSEAIRLDPKLVSAYMGRADAYDLKRNYKKVVADYTEAIRLDPKLVSAYIGRAEAYDFKRHAVEPGAIVQSVAQNTASRHTHQGATPVASASSE